MYTSNEFEQQRDALIGTIEEVSPVEIKVGLEIQAPQSTALNTGTPRRFPKINGYVLIPNEEGDLVCMVTWLGVYHSNYPKRAGLKDFDLIDLPFPLRKMSLSPMGVMKTKRKPKEGETLYEVERGIYSYPSVGDSVILPNDDQLKAIVETPEREAPVTIGTAPLAANASVRVHPDKLFGRHLAVLGNTGSGKSCSVAGLIRWSLEAAADENIFNPPNARFIILDPNGEYQTAFKDGNLKAEVFKPDFGELDETKPLKVPAWLWNGEEWSAFTKATGQSQKPILKKALRELRGKQLSAVESTEETIRKSLSGSHAVLTRILLNSSSLKDDATKIGQKLEVIIEDIQTFKQHFTLLPEVLQNFNHAENTLKTSQGKRFNSFTNSDGERVEYYKAFSDPDIRNCKNALENLLSHFGGPTEQPGPSEDTPIPFLTEDFANNVERISRETGALPYTEFLIMRIQTILKDNRMVSITSGSDTLTLSQWLNNFLDSAGTQIRIIDLSLVPSEIMHITIAVISRMVFETTQRYRRLKQKVLPTNLVLEEAHNFVRRYGDGGDFASPAKMCCQTFEKIAREGRKFGLGLVISSQRPSELSATVLSQCNTFLLHRLVNDEDQKKVRAMVPDNLRGVLDELPVLPSRKAILLGWATNIPTLVEMNFLAKKQRPQSEDPDFWHVWTSKNEERPVNWQELADDWQGKTSERIDNFEEPSNEVNIQDEDDSGEGEIDHLPF